MIRKNKKKVDVILCSDIHLTDSIPVARTDNYPETQNKKLKFLSDLQKKYNCPVFDAGDLLHHWKAPPHVLNRALSYLPENFTTIPGNHDLPENTIDLYHKCGLSVLEHMEGITIRKTNKIFKINGRKIIILHEMVWDTKSGEPWPDAEGCSAKKMFLKYPKADLILTGHNHTGFTETYKKQLLVNPGSMMRISADKKDYKPRCYLYYAKTNTVKAVYYPIKNDVHDLSHILKPREKQARIQAYIERMNTTYKTSISFKRNLKRFFKKNKTKKEIKNLILNKMEV